MSGNASEPTSRAAKLDQRVRDVFDPDEPRSVNCTNPAHLGLCFPGHVHADHSGSYFHTDDGTPCLAAVATASIQTGYSCSERPGRWVALRAADREAADICLPCLMERHGDCLRQHEGQWWCQCTDAAHDAVQPKAGSRGVAIHGGEQTVADWLTTPSRCTRAGCGKPFTEHDRGVFCP